MKPVRVTWHTVLIESLDKYRKPQTIEKGTILMLTGEYEEDTYQQIWLQCWYQNKLCWVRETSDYVTYEPLLEEL